MAIVGRACRLPGASSDAELWELLRAGRCSVSSIPPDRWPLGRHGHPRLKEAGRSYTWAAGVLSDIWGFDPSVFRISPREAQQMDPQQRLMLELAFEACEDAGFAPSSLTGTQTGVYVGASSLDYSTIGLHDPAVADAYYATGNTLSIVANRLSYIFDLHGPSLTIDTACSSSLVALHNARHALIRGEIETALVGGVSILAGPFGFISFSQATMLSPTGLCRAFSADADGYVRAEGGVVIVLKTLKKAIEDGDRIHAVICGSGVNSDGRTSGISLPSEARQIDLLRRVYKQAAIAPDSVVYVEAHGTGTRVGDPVEAGALGAVLGRARARPLPIGSIKTNIGHTEPAAGLAGLMKAMLALEHNEVPKSLHFDKPNPNIDFAELNLSVAADSVALPRADGRRFAGVSSFGFGGTSAHVVIGDPPVARKRADTAPQVLMLSAQTEAALQGLAGDYASLLEKANESSSRQIVGASNHRRQSMPERLVLPACEIARLPQMLSHYVSTGQTSANSVRGTAIEGDPSLVFVFSGNGSQWPGMGRAAYRANAVFRDALAEIDGHFRELAGWSLIEGLDSPKLSGDLTHTHIAQPMIFAIQAASVRALAAVGVRPSMTIGHSVGEVAATEAAGILSVSDAVRVIFNRSRCQEVTENTGGMAVVFGERNAAVELVDRVPGLSIAAYNSQSCIAVAGSREAIDRAVKLGTRKVRVRKLDLPYPFHTNMMAPVREPLLQSLSELVSSPGTASFLSTMRNEIVPGASVTADYWWHNVREPVLFQEAVERALRLGKRVFLEIGPRATLKTHLRDITANLETEAFSDCVLDEKDDAAVDPFERSAMQLIAAGAAVDPAWAFGPDPGAGIRLPAYPWRRSEYRFPKTIESTGQLNTRPRHPFIGSRDHDEMLEWRAIVDPDLEPTLGDHRVDGQVLLPGAAFVEMGLAAVREWAGEEAALTDFEILQPMIFTAGGSREVLTRISVPTATIEIMSRPRLSKVACATHARGKIIQRPGPAPIAHKLDALFGGIDGETVYRLASGCGLEFGPAFRQLKRAARLGESVIGVELTEEAGDGRFALDPARLDSCFHGLILLFADGARAEVAYLPVRFDEVRLNTSGTRLSRASIRVRRHDDRVILADFDLAGDDGRLMATIRGARYQAVRGRVGQGLDRYALAPTWGPARTKDVGRPLYALLRGEPAVQPRTDTELSPATILIEGWATSVAYDFFAQLAEGGVVDVEALILSGRLPSRCRRWADAVLDFLEQSDLFERVGHEYHIIDAVLPKPDAIFAEIASRHPDKAPELLLAASVRGALRECADGKSLVFAPSDVTVEAYDLRSQSAAEAATALGDCLNLLRNAGNACQALRVLQIGVTAATHEALRFADQVNGSLTVFDPDSKRLERARLNHNRSDETTFCSDLAALPDSTFDIVISAGGLSRLAIDKGAFFQIIRKCAQACLLIAVEPKPSLFRALTFGLGDEDGCTSVLGATPKWWAAECKRAGLMTIESSTIELGSGAGVLLMGTAPRSAEVEGRKEEIALVSFNAEKAGFTRSLRLALTKRGVSYRVFHPDSPWEREQTETFVWTFGETNDDGVACVATQALAMRDAVLKLGNRKARVYVAIDGSDCAVADATLSFVRTLANEYPSINFVRVEILDHARETAERTASLILSDSSETDFRIDRTGVWALRYAPVMPPMPEHVTESDLGLRLEKGVEGGLNRVAWSPRVRVGPGANEVEVEVAATGLNFRDVMWTLSVLPDEMFEDGYAGPTLGLEFSGRIARVGAAVEGLRVGDDVVGLAGGAFSTHVVVDGDHVAGVPSTMSRENAATVPVAFLTAYYGLISCADLERGEWVLVHGGAGGVGLAALQIARWRGARVIATAGSVEKRELVLALGAEHAFDSRSGGFVDDVMRVTEGRGVSVVLNSLAGEAMERSIGLLQPFGRFVELGKRDYLANTAVGLRPFKRNLSYFGVDLDQFLRERPEASRRLFAQVLGLFSSGVLSPLPYSVFDAEHTAEAMRFMQHSGHVGKILIRPPKISPSPQTVRGFSVDPDRTHLITGGFGGFGLATAKWLADRGARHIALVGRSGATSEAAQEAVARLREKGVEVHVAGVDIADSDAAEQLFNHLEQSAPALAGVMHAAMVLDDAIVANIDEERLVKVLRPKIAGAENLDRLARGKALDYFVLFSSATTLIGNPGQGAYVAANGYLEGLARRRRMDKLPALAVAWGAIGDVGVLARHDATRLSLAQKAGVRPIDARRALDLMAEILSSEAAPPVVAIADMNWTVARAHLPLLNSSSYARLGTRETAAEASFPSSVDLRELVARLGPDKARRAVADILVEEIAQILRLPRDDVSRTKPLVEIGLDSLMAVELMLGLERRFGMEASLGGTPGASSVTDLAALLLSDVNAEQAYNMAEDLAKRHLQRADWGDIAPLMAALEEKGLDLTTPQTATKR
ncbi:MAG: SDR family NAD(P)-dependent oxidoreductase [Xanthobacteraceae bacterium]